MVIRNHIPLDLVFGKSVFGKKIIVPSLPTLEKRALAMARSACSVMPLMGEEYDIATAAGGCSFIPLHACAPQGVTSEVRRCTKPFQR